MFDREIKRKKIKIKSKILLSEEEEGDRRFFFFNRKYNGEEKRKKMKFLELSFDM